MNKTRCVSMRSNIKIFMQDGLKKIYFKKLRYNESRLSFYIQIIIKSRAIKK